MDASDFVSNDKCVYPKRSKTNYASLLKHEYEYSEVRPGFDEDLFEEAVALATEEPSHRSIVHDNRVAHPPGVVRQMTFNAPRPTAETVAATVEASRDRFNERYDPQTFLTAASVRLDDLRIRIDQSQTLANSLRFERLMLMRRILAAEKRRAQPLSSAPEVEDEKPLMPFDWMQAYVGTLGFVGPQTEGNESSGAIRCLKRIDENRFVGRYELTTSTPMAAKRNFLSRPFLFVGVHRDEDGKPIEPGSVYRVKFNGIVTAAFAYSEPGEGDREIKVIEKFDPGVPFQ